MSSIIESNSYDIYDLYDLGEFDQKGGKGTKWGTKEELLELDTKAKEVGIGLYWDAVLNHKMGADGKEKCLASEVDPNGTWRLYITHMPSTNKEALDRTKDISAPYEIEAWLGFTFPGRDNKYSEQKYHWYHFSGTDFNALSTGLGPTSSL
jgi:alpha-amylase